MNMKSTRSPYPSDVSDDEWAFVAPFLTLMVEGAPQRTHDLREVFNGLRWLVRAGAAWRMLPHDLPPWQAVYQQTQRWIVAGCFDVLLNPLPPSSIVRRSRVGRRAGHAVVMTAISENRAANSMWPWIHSAIF